MAGKVICLAGLPLRSALNWDESELLQSPLPPFYPYRSPEELAARVQWRSLEPIESSFLNRQTEDVPFFTMGTIQRYSAESVAFSVDEDATSEFYDHSFAFQEGPHRSFASATKSFTDDSELTLSLDDSIHDDSIMRLPQSEFNKKYAKEQTLQGHLSDVEDIPRAAYLDSVAPRTVIVNLTVAVMSIRPRRRVRTRWGHEKDIVEILVGDETKSGFRVSCWVPASNDNNPVVAPNSLEHALRILRLRDVILLRSVALSSFRGQVYGQSLRENMTKIDILDRESDPATLDDSRVIDEDDDIDIADPYSAKIRRVRRWIRNFVFPGIAVAGSTGGSFTGQTEGAVQLPPDTPL